MTLKTRFRDWPNLKLLVDSSCIGIKLEKKKKRNTDKSLYIAVANFLIKMIATYVIYVCAICWNSEFWFIEPGPREGYRATHFLPSLPLHSLTLSFTEFYSACTAWYRDQGDVSHVNLALLANFCTKFASSHHLRPSWTSFRSVRSFNKLDNWPRHRSVAATVIQLEQLSVSLKCSLQTCQLHI